jgi:hypothetical protein
VVQALSIATYLFVGRLGEFYLLAVVFGTAYGGALRGIGARIFRSTRHGHGIRRGDNDLEPRHVAHAAFPPAREAEVDDSGFSKMRLLRCDTMRPDTAAIISEIISPEVSVPQNPNRLL